MMPISTRGAPGDLDSARRVPIAARRGVWPPGSSHIGPNMHLSYALTHRIRRIGTFRALFAARSFSAAPPVPFGPAPGAGVGSIVPVGAQFPNLRGRGNGIVQEWAQSAPAGLLATSIVHEWCQLPPAGARDFRTQATLGPNVHYSTRLTPEIGVLAPKRHYPLSSPLVH